MESNGVPEGSSFNATNATISDIELDDNSLKALLASGRGIKKIMQLRGEQALVAIDFIDKALAKPNSRMDAAQKKKYLRILRKLCGTCGILPTSSTINEGLEIIGDHPHGFGGFAEVWQGKYRGSRVAVKSLRISAHDDLIKVNKRFCKEALTWKSLNHPSILPFLGVSTSHFQFAMISRWMPHGNVVEYVLANPGANRLLLLLDVARGLSYLHGQDLVHADLKGVNILMNRDYRAVLADFGLMTVIPDSMTTQNVSTSSPGGTVRWMAPELLLPEDYGLPRCIPTKESDMYALGMVIYEVMTGTVPFNHLNNFGVVPKVLQGHRPERPKNTSVIGLTEDVWSMTEECWLDRSSERPVISSVLSSLNMAATFWDVPSPMVGHAQFEPEDVASDSSSDFSESIYSTPALTVSSIEAHPVDVSRKHDNQDTVKHAYYFDGKPIERNTRVSLDLDHSTFGYHGGTSSASTTRPFQIERRSSSMSSSGTFSSNQTPVSEEYSEKSTSDSESESSIIPRRPSSREPPGSSFTWNQNAKTIARVDSAEDSDTSSGDSESPRKSSLKARDLGPKSHPVQGSAPRGNSSSFAQPSLHSQSAWRENPLSKIEPRKPIPQLDVALLQGNHDAFGIQVNPPTPFPSTINELPGPHDPSRLQVADFSILEGTPPVMRRNNSSREPSDEDNDEAQVQPNSPFLLSRELPVKVDPVDGILLPPPSAPAQSLAGPRNELSYPEAQARIDNSLQDRSLPLHVIVICPAHMQLTGSSSLIFRICGSRGLSAFHSGSSIPTRRHDVKFFDMLNAFKNTTNSNLILDATALVISAHAITLISPQMLHQLHLAFTLGATQLVVIVEMSKTDRTEGRFHDVTAKAKAVLDEVGYILPTVVFIPVAQSEGDIYESPEQEMPWYQGWDRELPYPTTGHTVLEAIDSLRSHLRREYDRPPCIAVTEVARAGARFSTRFLVVSGLIQKGLHFHFFPAKISGYMWKVAERVGSSDDQHAPPADGICHPGDRIRADFIPDELRAWGGTHKMVGFTTQPAPTSAIVARLYVNETTDITRGKCTFRVYSGNYKCRVRHVATIELASSKVIEKNASTLTEGHICIVVIKTARDEEGGKENKPVAAGFIDECFQ